VLGVEAFVDFTTSSGALKWSANLPEAEQADIGDRADACWSLG
jgi:hypothetical protein